MSPEPTPPSVVFENDRVLAVAKPSGQLVIPGRGLPQGPTLKAQADAHVGTPVFVVHRIDADSSGLVLFAKDAEAHRALNIAFEKRQVAKRYLALVQGAVLADRTVNRPLKQFGSSRVGVVRGGRPAITSFRVLERVGNDTLLEVTPETGKRHQIRVHLYAIGHPILGDPLYGEPLPVGGVPRLMLHALALHVDTVPTGQLSLRAEPPEDFVSIVCQRRKNCPAAD
ncbi:MAG: RNA pseudouridine synthase [Candidatus Coatesbacteria bacterium]